jgi:ketosteroid isomerase-like protein
MANRHVPGVLSIVMCAAFVSGCAANRTGFSAQDEAAIRAASAEYARLETPDNADKWAALSASDAVMMPEGGKPVVGHDALIAWAKEVPRGVQLKTTVQTIDGRDNVALERGTYDVSVPQSGAAPPQMFTGNYLVVWERQPGGGWLITRNIWNTDKP